MNAFFGPKVLEVTLVTVMALAACQVHAETFRVPGRGSYTIQRAIDMARDGDTIIVAPGVYRENIDFTGKAITVRSSDPDNPRVVEATILRPAAKARRCSPVVTFIGGKATHSTLAGMTVVAAEPCSACAREANGNPVRVAAGIPTYQPVPCGGAICSYHSSPAIRHCRILYGDRSASRKVLHCIGGSPTFADCAIAATGVNAVEDVMYCANSVPVLSNSRIIPVDAPGPRNDVALVDAGRMIPVPAFPLLPPSCGSVVLWTSYDYGALRRGCWGGTPFIRSPSSADPALGHASPWLRQKLGMTPSQPCTVPQQLTLPTATPVPAPPPVRSPR